MSEEDWEFTVEKARERAALVESVLQFRETEGVSLRVAVGQLAPALPWSTWLNWRRKSDRLGGPAWERQLDGRLPPSHAVSPMVQGAVQALRGVDREMSTSQARAHLVKQFGVAGAVSDSVLRDIWAKAGLANPRGPRRRSGDSEAPVAGAVGGPAPSREGADEVVERFGGGAGLALVFAADVETGAMTRLATAIQGVAENAPAFQGPVRDECDERDERGRFTPEYNALWRADVPPGEADARWTTDARKATWHDVSMLRALECSVETLSGRLFAMGATPLVTSRRGFDGLAGPAGDWLGVTGRTPYMPATLDKTLAELGLLGADDVLWDAHAAHWSRLTAPWSRPGPAWIESIAYIDGTADPYWTHAYAKSGKVSRVGRVMPCISRVAVNSGAGVPLLVTTHTGAMPLKRALGPLLDRLRKAIGPDAAADRLTVVDSEAGNATLLWELHDQHDLFFITVIKGNVLKGATVSESGPWSPYRERDELCESLVSLASPAVPGGAIQFRAVQMRRRDGRQPKVTLFATNASKEDITTQDIAAIYLARWPRQEQLFRDARNGGGLNRSFGYGRDSVIHLALAPKKAKAAAGMAAAEKRLKAAEATLQRLSLAMKDAPPETRQEVLAIAKRAVADATKVTTQRTQRVADVAALPTDIQERDTCRDAVMTCLKVTVLLLLEYVLKEYFGGLAAEWRTYIEELVALPVTVRTSKTTRLIQIHKNPRQPERMKQLQAAMAEINRRSLQTGKHKLRFELADTPWLGPSP
jgi:hypothetical protein